MLSGREKEDFVGWLRARGQRVTRERLVLLDEIFARHEHLDADSVLASLQARGAKTSRATVYRNLALLVEAGFVRRTRLTADRWVYEHVHRGQAHDHLVCEDCERVIEFVSPGVRAMLGEIARAHGFVASRHALQLYGRCLDTTCPHRAVAAS